MTKIEIFNEVCGLISIYMLICFTDLIAEPETRHFLGYFYIFVSLFNITVHLVIITFGVIRKLKDKIKQKCCKQNQPLVLQSEPEPSTKPVSSDSLPVLTAASKQHPIVR